MPAELQPSCTNTSLDCWKKQPSLQVVARACHPTAIDSTASQLLTPMCPVQMCPLSCEHISQKTRGWQNRSLSSGCAMCRAVAVPAIHAGKNNAHILLMYPTPNISNTFSGIMYDQAIDEMFTSSLLTNVTYNGV